MWGRIDLGGHCFRPRLFEVYVLKDFCYGDGTLSSPGAAGSMSPSNQSMGQKRPHRLGVVSTRGIAVFVPG